VEGVKQGWISINVTNVIELFVTMMAHLGLDLLVAGMIIQNAQIVNQSIQ